MPWQTYPGHLPCPVADENPPPNQWSMKSRHGDTLMRRCLAAALSPGFAPVLRRSTVLAAVALHGMGFGDCTYLFKACLNVQARCGAGADWVLRDDGFDATTDSQRQSGEPMNRPRAAPLLRGTDPRPVGTARSPAPRPQPAVLSTCRGDERRRPTTYAQGGVIGPVSEEQFRAFRWAANPNVVREALVRRRQAGAAGPSRHDAANRWTASAGWKRIRRTCSSSTWSIRFP